MDSSKIVVLADKHICHVSKITQTSITCKLEIIQPLPIAGSKLVVSF